MRQETTYLALGVTLLMLSGCDWLSRPPAKAAPASKASQPAQSAPQPQHAFKQSAVEQLEPSQRAQLERAKAAQAALAKTLLATVTDAVQTQGPAQAIEVCATKAPQLAADIAAEHKLSIGRTSFKLRQPQNSAPDWAQTLIEARHDKQAVLTSEDGRLAVLSPIRIMEPCLKCHGEEQALAPGVKEALASRYPQDQATGFKGGDLRGWFWIEVPADAPTTATP